MEEDTKKISFGFKQVSKPKLVQNLMSKTVPEKTDFIECVEEKSIKVVGVVEDNVQELVILMQPSFKRHLHTELVKSKQNGTENKLQESGATTLDEMAVQAILSDCQKKEEGKEEDTKIIDIPMTVNHTSGKEVSKLEDYANVPVQKFGYALLRGMGWESTKGIGKNAKVIKSSQPQLRPKGIGLGADKLIKRVQKTENSEEELKLKDGSYVQFVLGRLDGQYGQIKGFDEGASMVMVKIARNGQMEKVNENTFRLVTKKDYVENSKVINIKEYKEYHEGKTKSDNSENQTHHHVRKSSKKDICSDHRSRHHKTKKSKHSKSPHRKHKSDHNSHKKNKHKRSS